MTFTLAIKNAPSGSKWWMASSAEGMYNSPWLALTETWTSPYGGWGETIEIVVVDSAYSVKHSKSGLGPIYDGRNYIYDCSTGILSELMPEPTFANLVITQFTK